MIQNSTFFKRYILLFVFFSTSFSLIVNAQSGPGSIWYFGQNAGLDFTSGSPVALTNGKINTNEGCSVISDCSGKLLFYTDGVSAWTKNHTVMPNGTGLKGNWTSTESSVVVPVPGTSNLYYLFTVAPELGPDGFNYSIVDMNLNGGLGDIIGVSKNIHLLDSCSEKLTAVKHANGTDYWIIVQDAMHSANGFHAFLLTNSGLSAGPVSLVGAVANGAESTGYIRLSPDGKKLAQAFETYGGEFEIYDFDNSTGIVSNAMTFSNIDGAFGDYGLEFSPDGHLLYVGYETDYKVLQFDLTSGSQPIIAASATQVATTALGSKQVGALQLGPDGKIYVGVYGSPYLGVINSPNTIGVGCNYVDAGVYLGGKQSLIGLPNFVTSFFNPSPPINTSIASSSSPSCAGSSDGTAVASASGGTGTYTYSWSNNLTGATATGLSAGTYTVTVTGSVDNGCNVVAGSNVATVTISDPTPMDISTGSSPSSCGQSNGSVWVTAVSNGSPGYNYYWSIGVNDATSSNLVHGDYTVTVVDAAGCSATQIASVYEPAVLTASISSSVNTTCGANNGSVDLAVSGGVTTYYYNWSDGETTSSISNLATGNYDVTVTDSWGCTTTTTAFVDASAPVTVSVASQSDIGCKGQNNGSVSLSVSGGSGSYNYSWSDQSGSTSSTVGGLTAGSYTVTVDDGAGCTSSSVVTINEPATILDGTIASTQTACTSNTGTAVVTPIGGTPGYSYNWSSGSTDSTATGLAVDIYTVTVTDNNGCTIVSTASVSTANGPVITIASSTDVNCFGASTGSATTSISGGAGSNVYTWSTGDTSPNVSGLSAGTYSVSVTDVNGCVAVTQTAIAQPSAAVAVASASLQNVLCNGTNMGSAVVQGSGGNPAYSYVWSNGDNGATSSNLVQGNYTITVTDNTGCIATTSVTLTEPAVLSETLSAVNVDCSGNTSGSASVTSVSGGTSAYNYVWSGGSTGISISNLSAGIYSVTITDQNGCTSISSVTVTEPSALQNSVSSQTDITCFAASTGGAGITASGGTSPYTYNWSNTSTTSTVAGLSAGIYTVTVTDANGCSNISTVSITQPASGINLAETPTGTTCGNPNGSALANASGGTGTLTYSWSNGGSAQTISGLSSGNYTVTVTDQNGCTTVSTATVNPSSAITITPSVTNSTCSDISDGGISLIVTGGNPAYTFAWGTGSTNSSVSNLADGTYDVTVSDAGGCESTTTVSVGSANPNPTANFNYAPNDPVYAGATIDFTDVSSGATNLFWNFGDTASGVKNTSILSNPVHVYNDMNKYCVQLKVTSSFGCKDSVLKCIDVINKDSIFIPNVFTPNGDGPNDILIVYTSGMKQFTFEVFDRWGLKIYEGNLPKIEWDGRTTAGVPATDGTYYYIYNGEALTGKKYTGSGFITLLRDKK